MKGINMKSPIVLLSVFWIIQASVVLIFKHGGTAQERWMPCFIIGNAIGITSTWLWMLLMQQMNPNIASGLAIGGAFLAGQISLLLVYRNHLSIVQVVGILSITIGMFCLCFGGKPDKQTEETCISRSGQQ
jgi:hypothetical protein